jgi:hypothetical protein
MKAVNIKGMSLIEIVFALAIVCFLLSVAIFQFAGTKRIHYISNEYLNKACLADIAAKLIKDQIQINPYFFKNINNAVVKNPGGISLINRDEDLSDAIGGAGYSFVVTDFPVISSVKKNTADGQFYYFGLFKVENTGAIMASGADAFNSKAFLNIKDLQKYSFDLSITDESQTSLNGILKNIDIKIKYGGAGDSHPFLLSTKVICPPESLSSIVYSEFQKKLFETSRGEFLKNMNLLLKGTGPSVMENVNAVFEWLCSKNPPPLMFKHYAASGQKLEPEYKKTAERHFKNVYFLIYIFDFNAYMQSVWADRIDELSVMPGLGPIERLLTVASTYRKKAQLALQTADQARIPLGEICAYLQNGTKDTVSVMLASFLKNRVDEFLDYKNTGMFDIIKNEVKQLPEDFTADGIKGALEKFNALLSGSYQNMKPRALHNILKEMTAFNEVNEITANVSQSGYINSEFKNAQNNIKTVMERKYEPDKFEAGAAYLKSEMAKNELIDNLIDTKYKVAAEKIQYFWDMNRIAQRLDMTLEVMIMAINQNISANLNDLLKNDNINFRMEYNRDLALADNDGMSRDEFLRRNYNISEIEYDELQNKYGDNLNALIIRNYVEQRDR